MATLKPSSILIVTRPPEYPWWVKIGDFGLSKRIQSRIRGCSVSTARGTPPYMAPEFLELARSPFPTTLDPKAADIWALGETAHQLLTGSRVFECEAELRRHVLNPSSFPTAKLERGGVSGQAVHFVLLCMALQPESRCPADTAAQHMWIADEVPHQTSFAEPFNSTR